MFLGGSGGSLRLGRLLGFPVDVHFSLVLLLGLLAVLGGDSFGAGGLLLAVGVFGSVLVHELGHAVVARRLGIPIAGIRLYPFGGVARMTRMPRSAPEELAIAVAGPGVSLGVAAAAWLLHLGSMPGSPLREAMAYLSEINLMLGLFNLAPALPMDGGRVLRALLSFRYGFRAATRKAARVARLVGWGFIGVALLAGNPWLVFVAVVVLVMANQEAAMAERGVFADYGADAWRGAGPASSPFTGRWRWVRVEPFGTAVGPDDAFGGWGETPPGPDESFEPIGGTGATRRHRDDPRVELPRDKRYTVVRRADGSIVIHVENA